MNTLSEIKAEIDARGAVIGAPESGLPTYGHSEDFARPHIEVDAAIYHYVVVERGREAFRLSTPDLETLLERVFDGVTFAEAVKFELARRDDQQDCRRVIFARQIELLGRLSQEWADRQRRRHEETLRKYPFDDAALVRARLCAQLRSQGHSPEDASRIASVRYPEPPGDW
jgi:hypothetical protein